MISVARWRTPTTGGCSRIHGSLRGAAVRSLLRQVQALGDSRSQGMMPSLQKSPLWKDGMCLVAAQHDATAYLAALPSCKALWKIPQRWQKAGKCQAYIGWRLRLDPSQKLPTRIPAHFSSRVTTQPCISQCAYRKASSHKTKIHRHNTRER